VRYSDLSAKPTKPLTRFCKHCGQVSLHYPLLDWCRKCRKLDPNARTARERYEKRWHRIRLGGKDRARLSFRVFHWYRYFRNRWS